MTTRPLLTLLVPILLAGCGQTASGPTTPPPSAANGPTNAAPVAPVPPGKPGAKPEPKPETEDAHAHAP